MKRKRIELLARQAEIRERRRLRSLAAAIAELQPCASSSKPADGLDGTADFFAGSSRGRGPTGAELRASSAVVGRRRAELEARRTAGEAEAARRRTVRARQRELAFEAERRRALMRWSERARREARRRDDERREDEVPARSRPE